MSAQAKTTRKRTLLLLLLVLAAMALAVVLAALPAQAAATFTVDSTNDAPDADPGDGACSTAADECTLRAAIGEANALSGDDVVGFAPTVSGGTITLGGSELFIDSNLKVEGPGADALTVDADSRSRVFNVQGGTVEISGLTITGGKADVVEDCHPNDAGGGIFNDHATLTLSDATVSDNTAACLGGGIFNYSGTLTVSDTTISGNATETRGGGVFAYHYDGGSLSVERSTISGNEAAQSGGGIYTYSDSSASSETAVTDSTISGNEAGTRGGGIYTYSAKGDSSQTAVTNSTISGNEATQSGGGIYTYSDSSASKTAVTNSTISANTAADGFGGGLYNVNGLTQIAHSTITKNSAPAGQGAGVASYGDELTSTEVYSSIVSANIPTDATGTDTGTDVDFVLCPCDESAPQNSFVSEGYNLIGDGNATAAFGKNGDRRGVEDPLLGALADNGGPTQTHALKATSPALNAGPPADQCPPTATDQRGVKRPQGDRCDVGAFERTNAAPTARADSYAAIEDRTLTAKAPGVLANDSDPEGAKLSASLASGPRHGKLTLRIDGSFVYTPDRDYSGTDSFTYRATDGAARSKLATVKISVRVASEPKPHGCTIVGTSAKDRIVGTARADVICALGGNDAISALGGNDAIYGNVGIDAISGGGGDDRLYGGGGGDTLEAKDGSGGDLADGGSGTDACSADRGDTRRNCP